MSRGGARVWGNTHPAAQLTEKKVIRYRALVRTGKATVGEIAAREGCSHGRISMAMRGETWAHLNDVAPPVPGRPRGPTVAVTTRGKSVAKKAGATKSVAKRSVATKSVPKKAVAKKTAVKTTGAKKTGANKAGATKPAAKKTTAKRAAAKTARR